jgi:hypothetical protein
MRPLCSDKLWVVGREDIDSEGTLCGNLTIILAESNRCGYESYQLNTLLSLPKLKLKHFRM